MKLTTRMRYGTRIILELASVYPDQFVPVTELSNQQDLSVKFIEQIIIPLRTAGLVVSKRGKYGGYKLAKHPSEITLLDIYNILEGDLQLVNCLRPSAEVVDSKQIHDCGRRPRCNIFRAWERLQKVIEQSLNSTTVESLIKP